MSSIGPHLPPHLTKRSRSPSPKGSPPRKHPRRGAPPNADEIALEASDSSDSPSPGPAPPVPNADEIDLPESDTGPAAAAASSDSDSDDYGPSLPSATAPRRVAGPSMPSPVTDDAPRRDDWMLAPPPSSSTFSERDPTRLRARKFASKPPPSSSAAGSGSSSGPSIWTETPEEKLRRLRDTVLGRAEHQDTTLQETRQRAARDTRDRDIAARIDAQRGKSLYEEHREQSRVQQRRGDDNEEDDPSKRAFDRDKDMALGGKIGAAQRRELVRKSAGFGGRFAKGSFL